MPRHTTQGYLKRYKIDKFIDLVTKYINLHLENQLKYQMVKIKFDWFKNIGYSFNKKCNYLF